MESSGRKLCFFPSLFFFLSPFLSSLRDTGSWREVSTRFQRNERWNGLGMKVSDSDPTTLINFDIAAVITGVIKATGIVIELRKAICTGSELEKSCPIRDDPGRPPANSFTSPPRAVVAIYLRQILAKRWHNRA